MVRNVCHYNLSLLLAIQASDIELNPGPGKKCKFPCQVCQKAVKWDPKRPGIACDNCSLWYHKDCLGMNSRVFEALANTSASWICCSCGIPQFSTSLFESFAAGTKNSFGALSSDSNDSALLNTTDIGSPRCCSSPVLRKRSQKDTPIIRSLVVNFQSVFAKRESLWELISSSNPDIIFGTETWLSASMTNSEILPAQYHAYRKDRTDGYGGVIIAIKSDLVHQEIELETTCEMAAAKVFLMNNQPPLVVVAAYRPTNRDCNYQEQLCSCLESLAKGNPKSPIWVGGDCNLPDINWASQSIISSAYPLAISESFLDMMHIGLKQIVDFPTRLNNILDLFLTNRPTLIIRCEAVPGLSDHDIVYIESRILAKRHKPVARKIHLWNKTDFDKVRELLLLFF